MRILKILHHQQMAGTELSAHASAQALARRGHNIYLLHNHKDNFDFDFYTAQLGYPEAFPTRRQNARVDFERIRRFIIDNRIEVAHIHMNCRENVAKFICKMVPTLYTRHVPLCPNGAKYLWRHEQACQSTPSLARCLKGYLTDGCGTLGGGQPWSVRGFAYQLLYSYPRERQSLKQYSRIITVSREHRREMQQDFALGERVVYVPEPVIDIEPNPRIADHSNTGIPVIFAAGRLIPFKGFHHLIEASAKLQKSHRLIIAGEGPEKEHLMQLAANLGIADRVDILGHVSYQGIQSLFAQCTLTVVPSLLRETLCRVGIEAMSWGKPVIAYLQGGVEDWLQDGVNGLAVKPGDIDGLVSAIYRLLNDAKLCNTFGIKGKAMSMEWAFDNHAAELEKVFESTLKNYA